MAKSSSHIVHQSILSRKWRYELPYFLPLANSHNLTVNEKEDAISVNELMSESYRKSVDLLELKKKKKKKKKSKLRSKRLIISSLKNFILRESMTRSWSGWLEKSLPVPTQGFYFTQTRTGKVLQWDISDAVVELYSGVFYDLKPEFVLFIGNWNGMYFATAGYAVVRPGNLSFLHRIYLSTFVPFSVSEKKKDLGLFKYKRNLKYRGRKRGKVRLIRSKRRLWVWKHKLISISNYKRRKAKRKRFIRKPWSIWSYVSKLKKLKPWTSNKRRFSRKWWLPRRILLSGLSSVLRWKVSRKLIRTLKKKRFNSSKRRRLLARRRFLMVKRRPKRIGIRRMLSIYKKKKIFSIRRISKKRLFKRFKRTFVLRRNVLRRRFVRLFKYWKFRNLQYGLNFCYKLWKRGLGFTYRPIKKYYVDYFNKNSDLQYLHTSWWKIRYHSSIRVRYIRKGTKSGKIYKRVNSILHI